MGLTLVGSCSLNPQPLPPLSDQGADAGSFPANGSSSGGGSGGGNFSSSGSSSGGSSGGATMGPVGDDAGVIVVGSDATAETSDAGAATDASTSTDAELPGDSGADSALPDGAPDASPDASPDAALDDASPGDSGCMHATDCYLSHPGACAECPWPQNYAVCIAHECRCGCDGHDAAGE